MTVTFGFYDSNAGDRKYNASQVSRMFEGIITSGIFQSVGGSLIVSASTGMTVNVATGRAWFNNTWTLNDSTLQLTLDASEVALKRIDRVILEVDTTTSVRANSIKILKGTPGSSPVAPTLASGPTKFQYSLADIAVDAGVTSITAQKITNMVGTAGTPLITGILTSLDTATLLQQYEASFNAWFTNLQNQLDSNQAANLQNQINYINNVIKGVAVEGLKLVWNSGSSITVDSGGAYTPSSDYVRVTTPIVKTGISLGNNVWGHVYCYMNSGTPSVVVSTAVPALWQGPAYYMTGDNTKRYLGSVRTDASGNIYEFRHQARAGLMMYSGAVDTGNAPFRCLAAGTQLTATAVSLSNVVPITSQMAFIRMLNLADKIASFGPTTACSILALNPGSTAAQQAFTNMGTTPTQGIYYKMQTGLTVGGAYVDVHGYYFDR